MPICLRRLSSCHVAHIQAVDQHRAAVDIVEARDQVDDGGLAGAGWADDGDRLAGLGGEADVLQHRLSCLIGGADVLEVHLALDGGHLDGIRLVHDLRLDVQQAEDALAAGDGVLDVGPQDGDLLDGLVEALHVAQEGDHQAQRDGGAEQGSRR